MTVLAASTAVGQGLYVGGNRAVEDSLNGVWLCSVPRDVFGSDWTASVVTDSTWSSFALDGTAIPEGGNATFPRVEGGRRYHFSAVASGCPVEGDITFTWLPVMVLEGDFGYDYVVGKVSLNAPGSEGTEEMTAKLKWRGDYTNRPDKHKRNYHIKFLDGQGGKMNRSLLGLRKDNHWKLDAGQKDLLRVRNRVCHDLWLDMSARPWYADEAPSLVNGSRGVMVEVILNGCYNGIYNLMEPVDRKQLSLVKWDEEDQAFRGQLWFTKRWCRTATMSDPKVWNNDSAMWDGIEVCYPDFEEVNPTDWSTLAQAVTIVNTIDRNDTWLQDVDSLERYFDIPVMQDYFIFIVAMQILDNESKNIYYSCNDKTLDERLLVTPWDLDVSLGAQTFVAWDTDITGPERPLNWISHLPMYAMFYVSPKHRRQIIDRYWQLRDSWLDTGSLVARFTRVIDDLRQSGAAAREQARWSGDTDIDERELDLDRELDYVTQWIERRMAYLDDHVFARRQCDVNLDGEVNIADVNAVIAMIAGGSGLHALADVNGDTEVNIADLNVVIDAIFTKMARDNCR